MPNARFRSRDRRGSVGDFLAGWASHVGTHRVPLSPSVRVATSGRCPKCSSCARTIPRTVPLLRLRHPKADGLPPHGLPHSLRTPVDGPEHLTGSLGDDRLGARRSVDRVSDQSRDGRPSSIVLVRGTGPLLGRKHCRFGRRPRLDPPGRSRPVPIPRWERDPRDLSRVRAHESPGARGRSASRRGPAKGLGRPRPRCQLPCGGIGGRPRERAVHPPPPSAMHGLWYFGALFGVRPGVPMPSLPEALAPGSGDRSASSPRDLEGGISSDPVRPTPSRPSGPRERSQWTGSLTFEGLGYAYLPPVERSRPRIRSPSPA